MEIHAIFSAIQGEGTRIGTPEVFVRFQGCSVKCKWCDTSEAIKFGVGKQMTVEQIISEIKKHESKKVSLTGGEPLDQNRVELLQLIKELKKEGFFVTLETSGQKFDKKIFSPSLSAAGPTRSRDRRIYQVDRSPVMKSSMFLAAATALYFSKDWFTVRTTSVKLARIHLSRTVRCFLISLGVFAQFQSARLA